MCTVLVRGEDEPSTYISTHTASMSTLTLHIIYVASSDMRFIEINYKVCCSKQSRSVCNVWNVHFLGIIGNSTKSFANT
jgi:hypothetical protein